MANEKAILSGKCKREVVAGKHKEKEVLEAREEIDTARLDRKLIFQKCKYIAKFDGTEDNIEEWIEQAKFLISVEGA